MNEPLRVYACPKCHALYTAEMGKCVCSKNKMHNTPIIIDGIRFHSTEEGNEWQRLRIRERCGDIRDLQRQVEYKIFINGIHVCSWFADFVYHDIAQGEQKIIDVKGHATALYKLKKRLVEAAYGFTITEVTQGTRKNARRKRAA